MFMLLMWLLLLLLLLLLMWLLLLHSSCTACLVDNIECSSNRRWVLRVTCATTNASLLHLCTGHTDDGAHYDMAKQQCLVQQ
jgi:hypothetical protein